MKQPIYMTWKEKKHWKTTVAKNIKIRGLKEKERV
jgi:hypothetical protein